MEMTRQTKHSGKVCQLCGSNIDLKPAGLVRAAVAEVIKKDRGVWDEAGYICAEDLEKYRTKHIAELLNQDIGELSELEREVLESIKLEETVTRDALSELEEKLTPSEQFADRFVNFFGSWPFIGLFGVAVVAWMGVNTYLLIERPFDPYPYILLNLVLSCLAAIQAPIILMSQKRQDIRDRARAINDYKVNLKSEIEVRLLNQKLDHLMTHQWQRLLEIQETQAELMEEIKSGKGKSKFLV